MCLILINCHRSAADTGRGELSAVHGIPGYSRPGESGPLDSVRWTESESLDSVQSQTYYYGRRSAVMSFSNTCVFDRCTTSPGGSPLQFPRGENGILCELLPTSYGEETLRTSTAPPPPASASWGDRGREVDCSVWVADAILGGIFTFPHLNENTWELVRRQK